MTYLCIFITVSIAIFYELKSFLQPKLHKIKAVSNIIEYDEFRIIWNNNQPMATNISTRVEFVSETSHQNLVDRMILLTCYILDNREEKG